MATIQLPLDFKEFLKLLNSEQVEYLIVGGYAVGFYGYPRSTGDIDIWLAASHQNAERVVRVLRSFGLSERSIPADSLVKPNQVLRMGFPPLRIELLTSVSGLSFDNCYRQRNATTLDGIPVNLISLDDLKINKRSAGRTKDLNDLENLP